MLCALLLSLVVVAPGRAEDSGSALAHRWLFVMRDLDTPENVASTLALLPRAREAGYTAIVLSDGNLSRLDRVDASYRENLLTIQREAQRHG
ncbi:MAG: hypothetical protein MUQ65_08085, partial [Armatimonadetes bacterium]|nr:hypothetical protein [Armatimonadota bacterium]